MRDRKRESIKNWAEDDRPREKLLLKGAGSLSNAELIAILISSGNDEESAVALSRRILADVKDNLNELAKLSLAELQKYKGIGAAKAIAIAAALELGRRKNAFTEEEKPQINSSNAAFVQLLPLLNDLNYESFCILLLNRANKLIRMVKISDGGLAGTVADPKRIFKIALEHNAASIILAHNHPSGQLKPSQSDLELTQKLKSAGQNLDLPIVDHLIVGNGKYFSFADEGLL